MSTKLYLTTLSILLAFSQSIGQNNRLLIEQVTVIPVHVNQVWENQDVIIEDGIINQIRPHNANDTSRYDLGRINAIGKFLIPSFADAHSHFPDEEYIENYFLMNLLNGVTTLRSMRGEMWHLAIDKSKPFTPRLILSSPPISRRDSLSDAELKNLVLNYKTKGFDFIKILSVKDKTTFDGLVKYSKENNYSMAGHCPSDAGIFNLSKSGVYQSIEHLDGFFQLKGKDEINKAIDLTIANGVYLCPTLDWYYTGQVREDSLRQRAGASYVPKTIIEEWEKDISKYYSETDEAKRAADRATSKEQFGYRLQYLSHIYRQGGLLLIGPDASGTYGIPGFGIHIEMQHFSKAGISNYDILKAACYNLSAMRHTEHEWGTIKAGTRSDLLLLNANPLEDITHTQNIYGIIYQGKFYTKAMLEAELNKVR